jgi:hypothetical protein
VIIITGRNFGIIATDYKIIIIEERQMIIIQNKDNKTQKIEGNCGV